MLRLHVLQERKRGLVTEAEALTVKEDDGSITDDEAARLDALTVEGGEIDKLNVSIKREERLTEDRRSIAALPAVGEDGEVEDGPTAPETVPATARIEPEKFKSFGEQLQAIAAAGMNKGGAVDNRLIWGAPTGANEAVPSEGGFLVQQDFNVSMLEAMHDLGDLLALVRRIPIGENRNGVKLPMIDESSRVDGSRWGGVLAYWSDEADTVTGTKPKFRELEMSLKKLFGLGYATDELLADAVALEAILTTAFTEELTFKTENAIINGTGTGQPLGLLNSGAVIDVAKESGQAGSTVVTANIINMFARLPRRSARNAVWLINQDIWPQLWQLTLGTGTAVVLLFQPPGLSAISANAPFGTLLGRPVLPVEYCATLGTSGDILLVDLMQYLMIDKGGLQKASSMHVRFINDEMTFRFIFRVDGQPAWNKAMTPFKGTVTQSPYLSLATRS